LRPAPARSPVGPRVPPRPVPTSPTAAPPAADAGFSQSEIVDLYGVGTVVRLAADEGLLPERVADGCVIVLKGALELRANGANRRAARR
jgi:hypothetical protein